MQNNLIVSSLVHEAGEEHFRAAGLAVTPPENAEALIEMGAGPVPAENPLNK